VPPRVELVRGKAAVPVRGYDERCSRCIAYPRVDTRIKHADAPTTVVPDGPPEIEPRQLACYRDGRRYPMLVHGATVEEVESVIPAAIPPGIPPFAVLTCRATSAWCGGLARAWGSGRADSAGRARRHSGTLAEVEPPRPRSSLGPVPATLRPHPPPGAAWPMPPSYPCSAQPQQTNLNP
jgi:hypothetical protein